MGIYRARQLKLYIGNGIIHPVHREWQLTVDLSPPKLPSFALIRTG